MTYELLGRNKYALGAGRTTSSFLGEEWRLILVSKGSACYKIDRQEFLVEAGSMFLLGPCSRIIDVGVDEAFEIEIIFFSAIDFLKCDFIVVLDRGRRYRLLRDMFYEVFHDDADSIGNQLILDGLLSLFLRSLVGLGLPLQEE